jgi:5-formyltetrahydrofolate cyclo-ligase
VSGEAKPTISEEKRALRSELIAVRARLSQEERFQKSLAIAARLEEVPAFREARVVALYAPLGTEVESSEMDRRLAARGARVVYPRSLVAERRLVFSRCAPGDLVRGPLGAREPPAQLGTIDVEDIDCVVMPGVAFSLDGLRLGRGGGYYDVTLRGMPRAARVGVAFDAQVVPAVPHEPHDAPLDAVVTESRVLLFPRAGAGAEGSRR